MTEDERRQHARLTRLRVYYALGVILLAALAVSAWVFAFQAQDLANRAVTEVTKNRELMCYMIDVRRGKVPRHPLCDGYEKAPSADDYAAAPPSK